MGIITIGNYLKNKREKYSLSLEELSELSGIDKQTLSSIEDGLAIPTLDQFKNLSKLYYIGNSSEFFWTSILMDATINNIGVLTVGSLIRNTREIKRKHMREVAEYVGVDTPIICDIERGRYIPTYEEFDKICEFLKISEDNKNSYSLVYFDSVISDAVKERSQNES